MLMSLKKENKVRNRVRNKHPGKKLVWKFNIRLNSILYQFKPKTMKWKMHWKAKESIIRKLNLKGFKI